MSQLWTETFFPNSLDEFVGNSELVKEVELWAMDWNKKRVGKPLLFFGHVGSGKTCLAYLIARLNGWSIFELNTSDLRNKDKIERVVLPALQNASFSGQLRLVLLDEIDGVSGREDRGGIAAILEGLKQAKNPVILTANDIYSNQQMATIRNFCKKLEFKKINYLSIAKRLKHVCETQSVEYDLVAINALAKESSGDLRAALLDLQSLVLSDGKITVSDVESIGFREREEKIFSVLGKIFRAQSIRDARAARESCDVSDDLLLRWIEENIPSEFKETNEHALAWNRLSRADMFNGRILRRQHYGFLRYSFELATSGVALAHEQKPHDFIMYKFPGLLSKLSASSSVRALRKAIAQKIQKKVHASQREIISSDFPFLFACFEHVPYAVGLSAVFGLDEKEIAFLMQSEPTTKKVQAVFAQAQDLIQKGATLRRKPLQAVRETELLEIEQNQKPKSQETVLETKGQLKLF